ncbi:MAG: carboxypeptidase-like regulatory domain-containing protein, partial [Flavobacterium sp.]
MRKPFKEYLWIFFLFLSFGMLAQEKVTLSGTITDATTTETLIGASVYIKEIQAGTTTNEYGFFSISVPKGTYTVQVSYVSFGTIEETVNLITNVKKNYSLSSSASELQEVVINADKPRADV